MTKAPFPSKKVTRSRLIFCPGAPTNFALPPGSPEARPDDTIWRKHGEAEYLWKGLVEKEIKGGFEIRIAGGLRGFCPHSQMGLQHSGNPHDLIGQHLAFRITQYAEKGRNIIVSNRSVLEEERQKQREEQKGLLAEGMKVMATITSIHNFGAFVKIGSLEGLIPISEIGWDRVEDIHEVLEVGQEVEVMAMKLDWEKDRLSFSLKRALPDPWNNIEKDFPQGSRHSGTVVRLTNFGAFVSLAPEWMVFSISPNLERERGSSIRTRWWQRARSLK